MYVCMYVCVCVFVCGGGRCVYLCRCVCMCVYVGVCLCVCLCLSCVYIVSVFQSVFSVMVFCTNHLILILSFKVH